MKNEMKLLFLFTFIFTLFFSTEPTQAHPGNTDDRGGHTCRTNCSSWNLNYGQYHFHNGSGPSLSERLELMRIERCSTHKKNLDEGKYTVLEVEDYCLTQSGLELKALLIEEEKRKLEEERLFRLRKQRENNISNWVVFLSLLLSIRLYQTNSDYYKSLFSKAAKSGSWIFFIAIYFLNKRFPITFDWNGIEKLRFVFVSFSSIFLFKYFEDNINLSVKLTNFIKYVFDVLRGTYRLIINFLEKLKIFELINLIFIPLSILIKVLSWFFSFMRKPFAIISSFTAVMFTSFFPAVFYGIFGIIIFSTASFILINMFSLNFEFVASLIFKKVDVSGLNEIATFLLGFVGFVIGFIYYFIKNRKDLMHNFLTEYSGRIV